MRYIGYYLSEYKLITILAPLFKMLEAIFELLVPLVMARIIDVGIAGRDTAYVRQMCILLFLLAVVGFCISITAQFFAALSATRSVAKMRSDLFCHIMNFSEHSMDEVGAPTLVMRMTNDLNQVQNGINMSLRLLLRSPFIVFGATIMAFSIDRKAGFIFIGVIVFLSLFVSVIMRLTLPMYRKIQLVLDHLLLRVKENLEGVRVIRAFHTQERERKKFADNASLLYDEQTAAGKVQALLNPLTYVTVNAGVVILLWYTPIRVNVGALSQGEVVALCNYMMQILTELLKFANLITLVTKGLASASRVESIVNRRADERIFKERTKAVNEAAIEFDDVSFAYHDTGDLVLEHISFSVEKGQTLGILGGTGAGKSSIARLMRHAYDPSGGTIRIFGQDVCSYHEKDLTDIVANVPQKAVLFGGDIASNLRMAKKDAADDALWDALRQAQAMDFVREKEGGLYAKVNKGGSNFSGGQRQRLTIARAFLADAKILILDDSASALDLATESRLKASLDERKDLTKVIISQRASSVRNADKILVIENGWCVAQGTHDELLSRSDIYREIYAAQYPDEVTGEVVA